MKITIQIEVDVDKQKMIKETKIKTSHSYTVKSIMEIMEKIVKEYNNQLDYPCDICPAEDCTRKCEKYFNWQRKVYSIEPTTAMNSLWIQYEGISQLPLNESILVMFKNGSVDLTVRTGEKVLDYESGTTTDDTDITHFMLIPKLGGNNE